MNNMRNIPKILSLVRNPTKSEIFDGGELIAVNNKRTALFLNSQLGSLSVYGVGNNKIGEIIIFSRALNEEKRQSVENYLSQKWKIIL